MIISEKLTIIIGMFVGLVIATILWRRKSKQEEAMTDEEFIIELTDLCLEYGAELHVPIAEEGKDDDITTIVIDVKNRIVIFNPKN